MAAIRTIKELEERLKQSGPLATVLSPQDFASEGLVADTVAKEFKNDLNPTQMRKVFHSFKQIERTLKGKPDESPLTDSLRAEISLLTPNLAYAAGRGLLPKPFYNVLKLCLRQEKLQSVADFRRLTQLITAILAYQKYHKEDK